MKIAYLALAVIANAAIANAAIAADEITSLPGWEGPLHDSTRCIMYLQCNICALQCLYFFLPLLLKFLHVPLTLHTGGLPSKMYSGYFKVKGDLGNKYYHCTFLKLVFFLPCGNQLT